jgi:tRNA(adenine34) deaminase
MRHALSLANRALKEDQVPVGAVVVYRGEIVGEGWNQPVTRMDPTSHAEIMALRDAGINMRNYRLGGCVLYATLEPCAMCAGAIVHARIARLVFGAREHRAGAVCSHVGLLDQSHLNHQVSWSEGVMADECGDIMLNFFRRRRHDYNSQRIDNEPKDSSLGTRATRVVT